MRAVNNLFMNEETYNFDDDFKQPDCYCITHKGVKNIQSVRDWKSSIEFLIDGLI